MSIPTPQRAQTAHPLLSLAGRSLLLLLTLSLLTGMLSAQSNKEITALEQGKPIERELAGGQAHSYQIILTSGQYVRVVGDQRGIDVVVTLFSPDGKRIMEVDSPNGSQGPEPVFAIAETSGSYRLEVRSLEKDAPVGRYELKVEELRAATEQDKSQLAAERAFMQAELLRGQQTAESLQSAIKKYEEALPLYHAIGNRSREAITLNSIGFIYDFLGEKQKALESYGRSLTISRAIEDQSGVAATLNNLGMMYESLGEKQKALEHFTQALTINRTIGNRGGEATSLNNLGLVYDTLGEKQKALDYYGQALPLVRSVGDRSGEARTISNIGVVYESLGEKQKALEHFTQALTINRTIGDRSSEALTLTNIGAVYDSLGEKQKALEHYGRALPILQAVGNRSVEATTLNNIGFVYSSLGEKRKALDYLEQSLIIRREVGDQSGEAGTLTNISGIYESLGEKQKTLDYLARALSLYRATRNPSGEAQTLSNLGFIYSSLGEKEKALDYYAQALKFHRAASDRGGEAVTLTNIGAVYDSFGEKQKALDHFNEALVLRRAVGDRRGEAVTLNNIGAVYDSLGERQKALQYFSQALSHRRAVGDRRGEAVTLNNLGKIYDSLGEQQKALDHYKQSLTLNRAVADRRGEVTALYNLAYLERARGNLIESLGNIEAALAIIETLRVNISRQELRSSYFATVQNYYEFYIELLMRLHKERPSAGYDASALQASERARARSLLELLAESHSDIRQGVNSELLQQEHSLQQSLNRKAELRSRLLSGQHTAEQATAAAKGVEELTTQLRELQAKIRQNSPRYAALTQPQPLNLKETQQLLDSDTLLLEYSLGDERSYLWLVSPTEIKSFELPARGDIETAARRFYELLNSPNPIYKTSDPAKPVTPALPDSQHKEALEVVTRLGRMLLGQVASHIGRKRLVIVADGALQYVPFAALPIPGLANQPPRNMKPLMAEHEIVNLPSVSVLATVRSELAGRKSAPRELAILADPVFYPDDERVKRNVAPQKPVQLNNPSMDGGSMIVRVEKAALEANARRDGDRLPRLKGTRKEAEGLLGLVTPDRIKTALDFEASRTLVSGGELSQYRYVHFATHGLLDSVNPELSAIVLSLVDESGNPQDGYLRAHEIFNLNLPADVVVLSGCQTGMGKQVRGEGIIGLTRGFMYAGAPRVVVSLWDVDDEATAELMVRFYRSMLKEKMTPAGALRAAQVEMSRQARWQSPHYWAGFVLQGEWK